MHVIRVTGFAHKLHNGPFTLTAGRNMLRSLTKDKSGKIEGIIFTDTEYGCVLVWSKMWFYPSFHKQEQIISSNCLQRRTMILDPVRLKTSRLVDQILGSVDSPVWEIVVVLWVTVDVQSANGQSSGPTKSAWSPEGKIAGLDLPGILVGSKRFYPG